MAKYREVGRAVRAEMRRLTPLVEPLSIDEAFLDLAGTEALHGAAPAQLLAALARRVEATLGITVSIGLSYNKFLAKIASDLDKPRGFAVIGRGDAAGFSRRQAGGAVVGRGRGDAAPARRRRHRADRPARRASTSASWRRATAGSAPGSRAWPRARTTAPVVAGTAAQVDLGRNHLRPGREPTPRRWRARCGRSASGSRRG